MTIDKLKQDIMATAERIKFKWINNEGVEEILTYDKMTPQQLADGYCDAEEAGDEVGRDMYWGALLLRYWYYIYKWYQMPRTLGEDFEDLFDWLNQSLDAALYYRTWRPKRIEKVWGKRNPTTGERPLLERRWIDNPQYADAVAKDEKAAQEGKTGRVLDGNTFDRSMHYFLGAQRGRIYQEANKQLRRGNYQTMSIDSSFDEDGYCVLDKCGLVSPSTAMDPITDIINELIAQGKEMEAVMIDFIAHGDSYKVATVKKTCKEQIYDLNNKPIEGEYEDVEYKQEVAEFSARKVVAEIKGIQDNNMVEQYVANFMATYKLKDSTNIYEQLTKVNSPKIYKLIEIAIQTLRNNPDSIKSLASK